MSNAEYLEETKWCIETLIERVKKYRLESEIKLAQLLRIEEEGKFEAHDLYQLLLLAREIEELHNRIEALLSILEYLKDQFDMESES